MELKKKWRLTEQHAVFVTTVHILKHCPGGPAINFYTYSNSVILPALRNFQFHKFE